MKLSVHPSLKLLSVQLTKKFEKWLCFRPGSNRKTHDSSSCWMSFVRSAEAERLECFPDSGVIPLMESYWLVTFISSPTLLPILVTESTDKTFDPREPMAPLHSWLRCSKNKSHGMFFPGWPCTFTVRSHINCCFILGVKIKSCWASRMNASME